jgi:hypothetical protein
MPNKMNMAIAKTHRLSSRVVGMQITAGTFVGIALSAIQMSAGFLVVGQGLIHGNFIIAGMVAVIGVALAILIERLSLGGLSAIRVACAHKKRIEDEFYAMLRQEKRVATEIEQTDFDRQEKSLKGQRNIAIVFAAVGMLLSAGVGDVFWHSLFESYGVMGYVLSTACAAVIGLTFVHSELYKVAIDGVLREILSDLHIMKVAVAAEGESMQVDMMVDAFDNVRANDEVRMPAQLKVERTVIRRLSTYADQVSAIGNEIAAYNNATTIESVPPLAIAAPRGKYAQHRDELRRLMMNNPNMSQGEVARHFNISKSTANAWIIRLRSGA